MDTALCPTRGAEFRRGVRAGTPIAPGYFAVSFSPGIAAGGAGITAWQGGGLFPVAMACCAAVYAAEWLL